MDQDRYHEGPLTIEALREWAYDEDMYFSSQDEDSILAMYDSTILFEFADAPKGPKAGFVWSVINSKLRNAVLHRAPGAADEVRAIIALCTNSTDSEIQLWGDRLTRSLACTLDARRVDRAEALRMGELLLAGFGSAPQGQVSMVGETRKRWTVERVHNYGSDRLLIEKQSGEFRYQRAIAGKYIEK